MRKESRAWLENLASLWQREREATQRRFVEERQALTLGERVERGLALRELSILEMDAAVGGRTLLWLGTTHADGMKGLRVGSGAPVRLWWEEPDQADAVLATVARRKSERIAVMLQGEVPERLWEGVFCLDRDDPQATFQRGSRAIRRFLEAAGETSIVPLREVLLMERAPRFWAESEFTCLDEALNESQRQAVIRAMAAQEVALIHGPPGTGKTRTLVEVIRQAVRKGERVLATAASNTAVDNLAERLVRWGMNVVRLGHPARVAESVEAHTLDALLEKTEAYQLSRKWIIEANSIQRKMENRLARGTLSWAERKEMREQAGRLFRDARRQRKGAKAAILSKASVICATAAGADVDLLGDDTFDLVVLDEATQATDPMALVPICRAKRVVLAGDPCQLPPTVIDWEAEREGLGTTFFERLASQEAGDLLRLLRVQYRMHASMMEFPSQSMYEGKLKADDSVASHRLEELEGVLPDSLRPLPFVFLDTAGKGWEEERDETKEPSTSNPLQAERVTAEVRRLVGRGVAPGEIAVITPYDAQVRCLRSMLSAEMAQGLEVDSVDGFQGREKEAVIVDLVRSNDDGAIGFLKDTRRMNVALTRARRWLLVIGDSATLGKHAYYSDFLEHAEVMETWASAWDDEAPPYEEIP